MTLLPRSLFGRLVLLLVAVVALAVLTSIVLFRWSARTLINRQLRETKLVQLQAIRAALAGADGPRAQRDARRSSIREYGVRIFPESERPMRGQPPGGPLMQELAERLRERLGPETEIRFAPRAADAVRARRRGGHALLGRRSRAAAAARRRVSHARARSWTLVVLALLLDRRLRVRALSRAAAARADGRGRRASAAARRRRRCPRPGPSEIAAVNRGFNAMTAQPAADRTATAPCCWPACRTTCARRSRACASASRWARATTSTAHRHGRRHRGDGPHHRPVPRLRAERRRDRRSKPRDLDAIVGACVDRYARAGKPVTLRRRARAAGCRSSRPRSRGSSPNLIDNALAYGAPPVEVTTTRARAAWRCSTSPIAAPASRPTTSSA